MNVFGSCSVNAENSRFVTSSPPHPQARTVNPDLDAEFQRALADYTAAAERYGKEIVHWFTRKGANNATDDGQAMHPAFFFENHHPWNHYPSNEPSFSQQQPGQGNSNMGQARSFGNPGPGSGNVSRGAAGNQLQGQDRDQGSSRIKSRWFYFQDKLFGPKGLFTRQDIEYRLRQQNPGNQAGNGSNNGNPSKRPRTEETKEDPTKIDLKPVANNPFASGSSCSSVQHGGFSVTSVLPGVLISSTSSGNQSTLIIHVGEAAAVGFRMEMDRERNSLLLASGSEAPHTEIMGLGATPVDRLKFVKKGKSTLLIKMDPEIENVNANMEAN